MDNINACFISYRHTGDTEAHKYVQSFVKNLTIHLRCYLPNADIYFDEKMLKVGDFYNQELASELCRSACMVLFYSPCHFDLAHPYCAREYQAMLTLERRRLGKGITELKNKGLIYPVIFKGLDYLPDEIKEKRHYERFDDIVIVEKDFDSKKAHIKIEALAREIYKTYDALKRASAFDDEDCETFKFPDVTTIKPWLKNIVSTRVQLMPGH